MLRLVHHQLGWKQTPEKGKGQEGRRRRRERVVKRKRKERTEREGRRRNKARERDLMNKYCIIGTRAIHSHSPHTTLLTLTTYSMFSSRGYLTVLLRPNEFTTRCCTVYVVRLSGFWCN